MRLIIVRHGDPDYEHDTLTETGWKEARALAARFQNMDITDFYVSPLGRAQDTASCTLKAMNRSAVTCDWLQEFSSIVEIRDNPDLDFAYPDKKVRDGILCANVTWDVLPKYWTEHPEYYDKTLWKESAIAGQGNLVPCYENVTKKFDELLAQHGYCRHHNYYLAEKPNRDTLVFFCHFGLECVLISHLMGISPFIPWHSMAFAPTSVTTIYTEERQEGIAYFRASSLGDISHLYAAGMEPGFSARFCETYDSPDERH